MRATAQDKDRLETETLHLVEQMKALGAVVSLRAAGKRGQAELVAVRTFPVRIVGDDIYVGV